MARPRIVRINGTKYKCRLLPALIGWEGVEAYDWIEGYGFDLLPIRRPQTLKAIYAQLSDNPSGRV
jgi:hypothetical protein